LRAVAKERRLQVGMATLNVWVGELGDPCRIEQKHKWFVHVLHCDGTIVKWCKERYVNIPTTCGHAEFEVPPGSYMVCATWSPADASKDEPTSLGNHITHVAPVRLNCGDHACVTLFTPTLHFCGVWWLKALEGHRLTLNITDETLGAVRNLVERIPADELTKNMMAIKEMQPRPPGKKG